MLVYPSIHSVSFNDLILNMNLYRYLPIQNTVRIIKINVKHTKEQERFKNFKVGSSLL